MIYGILLLIVGIVLGYFLRNKERILRFNSRLTDGSIFMLLFFMGLSVGMDDRIISNFSALGLRSLIIALFAVFGSILVTFVVQKLFFNRS